MARILHFPLNYRPRIPRFLAVLEYQLSTLNFFL